LSTDGVLGTTLKRFLGFEEIFFPAPDRPNASRFITGFIQHHAEKEVLIIAGELDPIFFEADHFKEAIGAVLGSQKEPRIKIKIIFQSKSLDELKQRNLFLYGLASQKRVELYMTPERPTYHYICIDGRSLFIEKVHLQGERHDTYFMENAKENARLKREHFYRLIADKGPAKKITIDQ